MPQARRQTFGSASHESGESWAPPRSGGEVHQVSDRTARSVGHPGETPLVEAGLRAYDLQDWFASSDERRGAFGLEQTRLRSSSDEGLPDATPDWDRGESVLRAGVVEDILGVEHPGRSLHRKRPQRDHSNGQPAHADKALDNNAGSAR